MSTAPAASSTPRRIRLRTEARPVRSLAARTVRRADSGATKRFSMGNLLSERIKGGAANRWLCRLRPAVGRKWAEKNSAPAQCKGQNRNSAVPPLDGALKKQHAASQYRSANTPPARNAGSASRILAGGPAFPSPSAAHLPSRRCRDSTAPDSLCARVLTLLPHQRFLIGESIPSRPRICQAFFKTPPAGAPARAPARRPNPQT